MFRLGISVSGRCCLMSARWQGESCWHRVGIVAMVDMASGSMLGLWLDLRCSTEFSVFSSSSSSWEGVVDTGSGSTFSKLWISTIKACWKTWVATDMSSIPFGCCGDHGNITTSRGWSKCLSFEFWDLSSVGSTVFYRMLRFKMGKRCWPNLLMSWQIRI